MRHLLPLFWPTPCLLCDLPTENTRVMCDDCDKTLPRIKNMHPHDISLFIYEPPISNLITQFKFHGNLTIARFFAHCFCAEINTHTALPECIIPVPLHQNRLKTRGFNQALELAKPIGKRLRISVDIKTCIRIRDTKAQSSLPALKRKTNVNNAFALSYTPTAKHVAILDDVITTGSTMNAIAVLLKKSGVTRVDRWCCAKTNK